MSEIDVIALYQDVTVEAFRLEARQRYNVPYEEPLVCAFLEGRPQPADECMTNHFESTRALRAAGKRDYRVHVIELLLTPYLRYELSVYPESVEAGEEILIADRAWHPDLAKLIDDFALFDGDTDHAAVLWYRYNDNDELLSFDYTADPADIEICRRHRDLAVAHAVPYAEFIRMVGFT